MAAGMVLIMGGVLLEDTGSASQLRTLTDQALSGVAGPGRKAAGSHGDLASMTNQPAARSTIATRPRGSTNPIWTAWLSVGDRRRPCEYPTLSQGGESQSMTQGASEHYWLACDHGASRRA